MSADGQGSGALAGGGKVALEEEHELDREDDDEEQHTAVEEDGDRSEKRRTSRNTDGKDKSEKRYWKDVRQRTNEVAKMLPLLAAVAAPISTLLDIPALTEPWYNLTSTGLSASDPGANLVLSSFSLAFNIIANALLVARFTVREKWWRTATVMSLACWIIKVIIALVNLGIYGAFFRNNLAYEYSEAFWCAVGSVIVSGLITLVLILHYSLRYDKSSSNGALIRVAGAEFMLVVMTFVALIALEGLIFSRIEHWTFLEGIYFAVVTAFTIGFGDFSPTYPVSQVLLFPFAVLSVAMLAVQVGVLIDFISTNTARRKSALRLKFERLSLSQSRKGTPPEKRALVQEMAVLQEQERKEENWDKVAMLASSTASLVGFWLIGAAAFMAIEGWSFGVSMYFCYIFFLTIGYGDYSPITGGGRVFFIVWALLAVPVVTNFVVSTVSGLISSLASARFEKARDHRAPTNSEQRKFHSHAHNVTSSTQRLIQHFEKSREGKEEKNEKEEIAGILLGLAIRLEAQSTTLMLELLERSSKERFLLRADRNLQLRALDNLDLHPDGNRSNKVLSSGTIALEEDMKAEIKESEDVLKHFLDPSSGKVDTLEMIRRYRETTGALFAAGSRLLDLEGEARLGFERRLEGEEEMDKGGMLLGSGRQGDAERAYGVDV